MILDWIYNLSGSAQQAFFLYYVVLFVLGVVVYKLGFAKKLPILKSALIYVLLAFGCIVMAILGTQMPIAEILFFGVFFLAAVRWRMSRSNTAQETEQPGTDPEQNSAMVRTAVKVARKRGAEPADGNNDREKPKQNSQAGTDTADSSQGERGEV
jgi:hypothetical protein